MRFVAVVAATFTLSFASFAQDAPTPPAPSVADAGVDVVEPMPDFDPDDPMNVLNRMPPDVRAKLSADQIAHIVATAQHPIEQRADENIVIPSAFFGTIVGIVLMFVLMRVFRDRRLHETLRAMIDKGVDIPPALLVPPVPKKNDRRTGIILAMAGLGVCVFLYNVDKSQSGAWALGLVPFFLGLGYFIAWLLDRKNVETQ